MRAVSTYHDLETSDPFVLHGRELRDGVALVCTSRFSIDQWVMGPAVLRKNGRNQTLDFAKFPRRHRAAMKLLCYTALSGDIGENEDRLTIGSVVQLHYDMRPFMNWLADTRPRSSVADLTPKQLEAYYLHLIREVPSPSRRRRLQSAVAYLWRYRTGLGVGALAFDPRASVNNESLAAASIVRENRTPRIPEPVHTSLLVWAMRFVDDFSVDILEATRAWRGRRDARCSRDSEWRREPLRWGEAKSLIEAHLKTVRDAGSPLPGEAGAVNMKALSRTIGCGPSELRRFREQIDALAAVVGVSVYSDLAVRIKGSLEGKPWLTGIQLNPSRFDSVSSLSLMLHTACYIVIAFLSGMRDTEVKHLRRGSAVPVCDEDGAIRRWRVRSLSFKNERDEAGVPATWIVGAPAARAIQVLERLLEVTGNESEWLFSPVSTGPGTGSKRRTDEQVLMSAGTVLALNRFVRDVNRYCAEYGRDDAIPDHNGRPWHLATRQFRRTLAWYIARRPGGAIAGAIAYKHQSIQMFEGYAGTSDSGFRAEVEAEEALARGEHLLSLIERRDHENLLGPSAAEARARLDAMERDPSYAGSVQTDPKRFARLLTDRGPELYPGKYVFCAFDPKRALCHAASTGPQMSSCKPLQCRNVALTSKNVDVWSDELGQIEGDLARRPLLPPAVVHRLEQRMEQIRALITPERGND